MRKHVPRHQPIYENWPIKCKSELNSLEDCEGFRLGITVLLCPSSGILDYRYRGPGFDSRHYQKKVMGLERGPLSLVSTTEELLDRKVAAPV
jgi:hypothetical protein